MSGIEELLARDIAAVTGEVVVTDSDLQEAHSELIERINVSHRHRRIRVAALAAAAAVVIVAGGITTFALRDDDAGTRPLAPAPTATDPYADFLTGSAPTPELLGGVWRLDNGGVLVKFGADGTVLFDRHGTLMSHPFAAGTYAIDGDAISVTITNADRHRCVGKTFTSRASITAPGLLRVATTSDTTADPCSPMRFVRAQWEQALPTNNEDIKGLSNGDAPGWHPLSGRAELYGVFLARGGGHLLEIDRGGAYYVLADTGTTVDRGQWSLRGSDLTFTSGTGSAQCSKGDKLVLHSVEEVNPGTNIFRGTVAQNTCGGAWTPSEWILIPNEDS